MAASKTYTLGTGSATQVAKAPGSVLIANPTADIYIGDADVDSTGFTLAAGDSISIDMLSGDQLWLIASAGTPTVEVLWTGSAGEVA